MEVEAEVDIKIENATGPDNPQPISISLELLIRIVAFIACLAAFILLVSASQEQYDSFGNDLRIKIRYRSYKIFV